MVDRPFKVPKRNTNENCGFHVVPFRKKSSKRKLDMLESKTELVYGWRKMRKINGLNMRFLL